jgi:hypothetical protein
MPAFEIPEKFLVAFSFAGEQRDLVQSIASTVQECLGERTVFFDTWYEHYIVGFDTDLQLQKIYHERSVLVVPCISSHYGNKPWTRAEYEAIRALKMQLSGGNDMDRLRILPLRVGDGDVPGIFMNTICPDIRKKPVSDTVQLIVNRLRLLQPLPSSIPRGSQTQSHVHRVYLAECTPDLDDVTKPVNRKRLQAFLEDAGWTVLPTSPYPNESTEYTSLLEKDLRECLAFIQLLGPYPWRRGDFDRLQNKAAEALGIRRLRYCSCSESDLMNVEESHKQFIMESTVIRGSFEDFKAYVKRELSVLAQHHDRGGYEDLKADNPPLVRVVVRSANPDPLWEKAFQWIYEEEKILSDQLGPGESFEEKHRADPCHGFMIVCDADALQDGPLSPREYLQQCRLIQISEKIAARRPPVAVVYWPPPPPAWAKLVRCTPQRLHQVEGNAPDKLVEFFAQVRQVAQ